MSPKKQKDFFYPNRLGRTMLIAMEEIIGRNGVNAVLNQANLRHLINNYPPDNMDRAVSFGLLSQILVTLESLYGPRAGQGLALRTGRACFKHGLRDFGPELGFTDLAFRLLPLESKLRTGAGILEEIFNRYTDQKMVVDEDAEHFFLKMKPCPLCWGRQEEGPVCHLGVGLLQEALYWVSGGRFYNVEETECIARGDPACIIVTDKLPLD